MVSSLRMGKKINERFKTNQTEVTKAGQKN